MLNRSYQNISRIITAIYTLVFFCVLSISWGGCWKDDPTHCENDAACAVSSRPNYDAEKPFCHATGHFCWKGCNADSDCSDGWDCNDENRCEKDGSEPVTPGPNFAVLGTTCANNNECESRHCTDGVCCDVDNCGECQRCNADTSSLGQCAAIPDGLDLDNGCGSETDVCGKSCVDGTCDDTAVVGTRCSTSCIHTSGEDDNTVPEAIRNKDALSYFRCDGNGGCNSAIDDPSPSVEPCEGFFKCEDSSALAICRSPELGCRTHDDCIAGSLCDTLSEDAAFCVDPEKILVVNEGDDLQAALNRIFTASTSSQKTHIALYGNPAHGRFTFTRPNDNALQKKIVMLGMRGNRGVTISSRKDTITSPEDANLEVKPLLDISGEFTLYIQDITFRGSMPVDPSKRYRESGTLSIPTSEDRYGLYLRPGIRKYPRYVLDNVAIKETYASAVRLDSQVTMRANNVDVETSGEGIICGRLTFCDLRNVSIKDIGAIEHQQLSSGFETGEAAETRIDNMTVSSVHYGPGAIVGNYATADIKNLTIKNARFDGLFVGSNTYLALSDALIKTSAKKASLNESLNPNNGTYFYKTKAGISISNSAINDDGRIPWVYDEETNRMLPGGRHPPKITIRRTTVTNNELGGIRVQESASPIDIYDSQIVGNGVDESLTFDAVYVNVLGEYEANTNKSYPYLTGGLVLEDNPSLSYQRSEKTGKIILFPDGTLPAASDITFPAHLDFVGDELVLSSPHGIEIEDMDWRWSQQTDTDGNLILNIDGTDKVIPADGTIDQSDLKIRSTIGNGNEVKIFTTPLVTTGFNPRIDISAKLLTLHNVTILNNKASIDGELPNGVIPKAAQFVVGGYLTANIQNSAFADKSSTTPVVSFSPESIISSTHNFYQLSDLKSSGEPVLGEGDIAEKDALLDSGGTPKSGSLLIDSGKTPSPARDTDLLGNNRVQGDAIDIGAIEVEK